MLSKNDIVVDKEAFEEIIKNALTDMVETDVRAGHLVEGWWWWMLSFGGGWLRVHPH